MGHYFLCKEDIFKVRLNLIFFPSICYIHDLGLVTPGGEKVMILLLSDQRGYDCDISESHKARGNYAVLKLKILTKCSFTC